MPSHGPVIKSGTPFWKFQFCVRVQPPKIALPIRLPEKNGLAFPNGNS
jgi:hypothetical protein